MELKILVLEDFNNFDAQQITNISIAMRLPADSSIWLITFSKRGKTEADPRMLEC